MSGEIDKNAMEFVIGNLISKKTYKFQTASKTVNEFSLFFQVLCVYGQAMMQAELKKSKKE